MNKERVRSFFYGTPVDWIGHLCLCVQSFARLYVLCYLDDCRRIGIRQKGQY